MKKELCDAFCQGLHVAPVPAGIAVGTAFEREDGDRITFYVIGPVDGRYTIQDDGTTVPYLEAAGADLSIQTRADAFHSLLREYGVSYDDDVCELAVEVDSQADVPSAALKFVALLLRLQDLLLLTREKGRVHLVHL